MGENPVDNYVCLWETGAFSPAPQVGQGVPVETVDQSRVTVTPCDVAIRRVVHNPQALLLLLPFFSLYLRKASREVPV